MKTPPRTTRRRYRVDPFAGIDRSLPKFSGAIRFGVWNDYSKYAVLPCPTNECENEIKVAFDRLNDDGSTNSTCKSCARRGRPYESLYIRLIRSARVRDITVQLTYEQFVEFTSERSCHYCKDSIEWFRYSLFKGNGQYAHHIDRKNNELGYSPENCVVCCSFCNRLKGDRLTYEEMLLLGPTLSIIQKKRKHEKRSTRPRLQPNASTDGVPTVL
jgi:5-methylcytosine-specific restriction endonuclease McrA